MTRSPRQHDEPKQSRRRKRKARRGGQKRPEKDGTLLIDKRQIKNVNKKRNVELEEKETHLLPENPK